MGLKFGQSDKMVTQVMKKVDDTELDHKKRDIPLDQIDMNKDNEYIFGYSDIDFLASEIEDSGFHGAIEVYAMDNGRYEIMSGHRRYMACKQLGFTTIPCIVSEVKDPATIAEQIIMSNIHHRDMTPLRMARAIDYYSRNVLTQKKKDYQGRKRTALAEKFNISETNVQRYLNILKLIPELQKLCDNKAFPFNFFAETVAQCPEEMQRKLYNELLETAPNGKIEEMSRRMIEMQLETIKTREQRIKESQMKDAQTPNKPAGEKTANNQLQEQQSNSSENTGFISYETSDDGMQNLDMAGAMSNNEDVNLGDDQQVGKKDNTVDNEVIFHINSIENLTNEGAVYKDKEKVIDMLNQLIAKLSK